MGCAIDTDIERNCDDAGASGAQKFGYIANRTDFSFTPEIDGSIKTLVFATGKQMYKFNVAKNTTDGGYEGQVSDGGNKSFKFLVNAQFGATTQAQLNAIDDIIKADDLVVFMPTFSKTIPVYGINGGISSETFIQTTGKLGSDNSLHQILLSGEDNDIFPFFSDTNYQTSIDVLEGHLIPA